MTSPPVENPAVDSPTTTPKHDISRGFGSADKRGETSMSFASIPTTTSNHGSRSTTSNHGSGSNHGSRSGSSDGKNSNEDAADVSVERTQNDLRNNSFPIRSGTNELDPFLGAMPPLPSNNFPREMADCLRELLNTQKGAGGEVPPMPPPPDMSYIAGLKDFSIPFADIPADGPPEPPAKADSKKPRVQYVPVPCI